MEEITKEIVNRYLQNILFIDDTAYPITNQHEDGDAIRQDVFDANAVTSAFAEKNILCTVFQPKSEKDLSISMSLTCKADAVVVDWNMTLENKTADQDPEADAPEDQQDPRGTFTIKIINNIVNDAKDKKLKLVIVYTQETNLNDITENIYNSIDRKESFMKKGACKIASSNVLILIRAKKRNNNEQEYKYNPELSDKVLDYNKLPEFIVSEFATFICGILPNFALSTIAAIREQTSTILGLFSKDIDPAFLGQYASTDKDECTALLAKIFGAAVTNLIEAGNFQVKDWAKKWVLSNFNGKQQNSPFNEQLQLNSDNLVSFLESDERFEKKCKKILEFNTKDVEKSNTNKELLKAMNIFFLPEHDNHYVQNANYKWGKMVQHRNIFLSPNEYHLTTGTIVKVKVGKNEKYLICIQQRCDSVRLRDDARSFLFLPLSTENKGVAVLIDEPNLHYVRIKTYDLEIHQFKSNNNFVLAEEQDGKYVFKDNDNKDYIWVAELNEMMAQHIVTNYSSALSRVGIDNAEWVRLTETR